MLRSVIAFLFVPVCVSCSALAQPLDRFGYPRGDFGRIVLRTPQSVAGDYEAGMGAYKNEPIANYAANSVFRKLGRPVGRLDILTNVSVYPCTAFLISQRHILTNYHCVPGVVDHPRLRGLGVTEIQAVQLVLGYTKTGIEEGAQNYAVVLKPLEENKDLDYAILEVAGNPSAKYGWLRLSKAEPQSNAPLWIIGHPRGESQHISREQCKSGDPALAGQRLRHTCDTLPGNSGSPVIDADTKMVIAIHHAGSKLNGTNYAVPISEIVKASPLISKLIALSPTAATRRHSPLSNAARAWATIASSRDPTDFKLFRKRYGKTNPFYDRLAEKKLVALAFLAPGAQRKGAGSGLPPSPQPTEPKLPSDRLASNLQMAWLSCKQSDDLDVRIQYCSQMIKAGILLEGAYSNRAEAYFRKKEYRQAITDYTKIVEIDRMNVDAYNNRGLAHHHDKRYNDAIADFSRALKINPSYVRAYLNRGLSYKAKHQHRRAFVDYADAIKVNPRYAEAYFVRGVAYFEAMKYDRAITDFSHAIRIQPRFVHAYAGRYAAHAQKAKAIWWHGSLMMTEIKRAAADARRVLELDPEYSGAKELRRWLKTIERKP